MKPNAHFVVLLLVTCFCNVHSELFTGFTTAASAVAASFIAGFSVFECVIRECCNDKWISANFTGRPTYTL